MKRFRELALENKGVDRLKEYRSTVMRDEATAMSRLYVLERRASRLREERAPFTDELVKNFGNAHTRVTFLRRQRVRIEERLRQLEADKT